MSVDSNAFLIQDYDAYDVYECLKKSKKVDEVEVYFYDQFRRERMEISFTWSGEQRHLSITRRNDGDYDDEGVPAEYRTQLHFGFMPTSRPIFEYILGHCGGGWAKFEDTNDDETFKQYYPYGSQIKPGRQYFRKLIVIGKEQEQITNFFMGNNRLKIRSIFE